MGELVERAIRALRPDLFDGATPAFFDDLWADAARAKARDQVIKVLRAIREPTIDMEVAATEEWLCEEATEDRAAIIWRAMIDTALLEASPLPFLREDA